MTLRYRYAENHDETWRLHHIIDESEFIASETALCGKKTQFVLNYVPGIEDVERLKAIMDKYMDPRNGRRLRAVPDKPLCNLCALYYLTAVR